MSDARAATGPQTTGGTSQALKALGEKPAPLRCTGDGDMSRYRGGANEEMQ
ncbi:hypothetical protein [Streptomyces sp. NBC_00576]|uniref:hypothetical protein n=1 Tax=Streptomyces sp. NBC_00576 TaxID=2903665 RepID=UPI002E821FEB|nr:hypothetical protein [Streptomyces sp. NBC_00576]WUB75732.1 hypothetical protein OG734_39895 [Streptomyces sp. NBC_00576]